ncbi:MAG TPA: hypothetical protein VFQ80_04710 [Thermomicrobiales bacterium]|nr:hypothetical protein [Thermomicrobiales bacterium]
MNDEPVGHIWQRRRDFAGDFGGNCHAPVEMTEEIELMDLRERDDRACISDDNGH